MKRQILAIAAAAALCLCSCSSEPKDVSKRISDTVLRTYCLVRFDTDQDKKLSVEEADTVSTIDISDLNVKSLKGLENFRKLQTLDCSRTAIKSFDIAMPTLKVLKCTHNQALTNVDLRGCPSLQFLFASHTGLKSLSLGQQTGLYRLWIDSTPISKLDLTSCPQLNNINVQNCPSLKEMTLSPDVNRMTLYLAKDDALVVK
ncbi:MAG: hypothetical protein ACI399_00365 [Candidatus Cryptobacteroides sp.]